MDRITDAVSGIEVQGGLSSSSKSFPVSRFIVRVIPGRIVLFRVVSGTGLLSMNCGFVTIV